MKLMLLGAGSAIHTQRWANGLAAAGMEVVCVSQHPFIRDGWDARVECVRLSRQAYAFDTCVPAVADERVLRDAHHLHTGGGQAIRPSLRVDGAAGAEQHQLHAAAGCSA